MIIIGEIILLLGIVGLSIIYFILARKIDAMTARLLTIIKWCDVLRDNQGILAKDLQRLHNEHTKKRFPEKR